MPWRSAQPARNFRREQVHLYLQLYLRVIEATLASTRPVWQLHIEGFIVRWDCPICSSCFIHLQRALKVSCKLQAAAKLILQAFLEVQKEASNSERVI